MEKTVENQQQNQSLQNKQGQQQIQQKQNVNKIQIPQHNSCHYGKLEYWEKRYKANSTSFDWYQSYDGIKDIITQYITKSYTILNVGCGTSELPVELYKEGYKKIVNIDFSETCIGNMTNRYKDGYDGTFLFAICDVRDMKFFKDGAFDCVIDKGTLDCLLCGEYSSQNSQKMLSEVQRVLNDTGVYIVISYGEEENRKQILSRPEYQWILKKTYKIYKPNVNQNDPVFDVKNPENYHYAYVCKKGEQQMSPSNLMSGKRKSFTNMGL